MLIVKLTPACLDTSSFLVIVIVFWWLCRLCATMKTLCDAEPCTCDPVGRITCICQTGGTQELEVSREGVNELTTTSYLIIKDCTTVRIRRKSLERLKSLIRVNVVNVRNLTLEEHSFSWNDSAIYDTYPNQGIEIHVENATVAALPTYLFRGRIDAITFVRATIGVIRSYAFTSLAGTKSLQFRDCDIAAVESQAFKKFVVENVFSMVGGWVRSALPSRTLLDVAVRNELQLSGVRFERVHSAAIRVHGPRKFQIQNCRFARVDGEAFVVHTRGPVFVDDNEFGAAETGAFAGVAVEHHVLEMSDRQELVFENNTIGECGKAALLFNVNAFKPKLDWIYMDARCDCRTLHYWLTDVIVYSPHGYYPYDQVAPNARLDEIISCRMNSEQYQPQHQHREYMRLKDYSLEYCGEQPPSLHLFAMAGAMAALVLVALAAAYWIWYKNRRTRWLNVPQSSPTHDSGHHGGTVHSDDPSTTADTMLVGDQQPSPCYEEPSTSRRHIVFVDNWDAADDERRRRPTLTKETELHVIAESPDRGRHVYANQLHYGSRSRIAQHEYTNPYAELNREYKYRGSPHHQQLLTSDL